MYLTTGDCTIWFDREGFGSLDSYLQTEGACRKVFVLVDANTHKHCWPLVKPFFEKHCSVTLLEIIPGEAQKNLETAKYIWDLLLEHSAGRSALFVNLGGGVLCDIGGFCASVFLRGLEFINIPTTLLAQVDASVGGKNGIDYMGLKNMIGTFNQPSAVFINDEFLLTLEKRQILSGFAEALKHALIENKGYWNYLRNFDFASYDRLIFKSIEIKKNIVSGDYRENNERKKLNFGHTIGHAIESWFLEHGTEKLLHGEAIAAGMICESYISVKAGSLSEAELEEIVSVIRKSFPKIELKASYLPELHRYMSYDKKINESGKNFTLLDEIGLAAVGQDVSKELIDESLQYYIDLP